MKRSHKALCLTCCLVFCAKTFAWESASIVRTPLAGPACKLLKRQTITGDTIHRCPGVARHALLVVNSDGRASIDIEAPDTATIALDFWDYVTPTFFHFDKMAEWYMEDRHGKQVPIAVVFSTYTVDQADVAHPKPLLVHAVARISENKICITAAISGVTPHVNELVYQAATTKAVTCLKPFKTPH